MLTIVDMARFLLSSEKLSVKVLNYHLSQVDEWQKELLQFWEKWRIFEPSNRVFVDHSNDLRFCIPCMLHGDEGTGHRRRPVLQISWGSFCRLGFGPLDRMFLITSCSHKTYSKYNQGSVAGNVVTDRLLEECAKSALSAYNDGICVRDHTFYLVFLGLAGDHPFQTKAYRANRSHLKSDICPHCHANTSFIPFEDVGMDALWRATVFQTVPWSRDQLPPLGKIPGGDSPRFIRWDLMHMIPHGAAREFVASVICMMSGPMNIFVPQDDPSTRKKELRLDEAYSHFQSWLDCTGKHVRDMKDFNIHNLEWQQNRSFPGMSCKASDTTALVQWLIDFLSTVPFEKNWVLEKALIGLQGIDEFCRLAYKERPFWNLKHQKLGKRYLGCFLSAHVELAHYWQRAGWTFFKLVPKMHYAAHWHDELTHSIAERKTCFLSPGTFSTPILEDFIGVVSRIGRTSHPSSVPRTTIYKYLVQLRNTWGTAAKK